MQQPWICVCTQMKLWTDLLYSSGRNEIYNYSFLHAVFKISSSLVSEERVGSSCFLVLTIDVQGAVLAAFSPMDLNLFIPTNNKRNLNLTQL